MALGLPCLLCGATGSCVPAHFPKHTGMGGSKDKWDLDRWIPLCGLPGSCHDLVDGRNGIGSKKGHAAWLKARTTLYARLPEHQRRMMLDEPIH
jgi:hypothetical protein